LRAVASPRFVLTLSCPDRPGIVHAVAGFLVAHGANIVASQQYGDSDTQAYFMRVEFETAEETTTVADLEPEFASVARTFGMDWELHPADARLRVLIMVSKLGHCLNDLLFRWRAGRLPIEVVAVVSNHPDLEALVAPYKVPYHHVPVSAETRPEAERELRRLVDEHGAEVVVLARYMQILGHELCHDLDGRIINIHHSFLPSFRGARPYHQAHSRGVKLIGATAHYVTAELDEGPIIEQDVERVDHSLSPDQLAGVGHDIECQVLARAVLWHAEHRVLRNGDRTVVFR
jgi:formyltetrahydrofolate deformylase